MWTCTSATTFTRRSTARSQPGSMAPSQQHSNIGDRRPVFINKSSSSRQHSSSSVQGPRRDVTRHHTASPSTSSASILTADTLQRLRRRREREREKIKSKRAAFVYIHGLGLPSCGHPQKRRRVVFLRLLFHRRPRENRPSNDLSSR